MKVNYNKKFLKQLAELPKNQQAKTEQFVFEQLPNAVSLSSLGNIEKMQGYDGFYKIRFGWYRLGLQLENDTVIIKTVMHRKEIYKFFP
jgi:mRNA interferase RelE/StbE